MAAIDTEDVEIVSNAIYDYLWSGGSQDETKDSEELARLALGALADRLLPRDANHQAAAYHRTAGTGVEYACSTPDCIVTVTREEHTATWSVQR